MEELRLPYQKCLLGAMYILWNIYYMLWKPASQTKLKVEKVRMNSSLYISGALLTSLNESRKFLLSCVLSGEQPDSSFTL